MRGRLPPLQPFAHHEHGKDADPSFKNLFAGNAKVTNLTDLTGSEVDGVQLTDLTERGKDELALFVAKRKVVGSSVLFSPPPHSSHRSYSLFCKNQYSTTKTLPPFPFPLLWNMPPISAVCTSTLHPELPWAIQRCI